MPKDKGYWMTFKEHHKQKNWWKFLDWLDKITKRKHEQKNRRKK